MIIGTAGHIDHGKTALVRALTGVDTDRLPEEKKRGITIDLGFAPLEIEGLETIGVVDVPGHEAFVRTMLAGASGIDLALVVIAADEGIMPQTREHLEILSLLGIHKGVVALTKCDLVDQEWLALVREDVSTMLDQTPLRRAETIAVSVVSGEGISDLRRAIGSAAGAVVESPRPGDLFRMPIDRAFTVKGTGTVVTGTVWSGEVRCEDTVWLHPGRKALRVRAIQSHGSTMPSVGPGRRAAIALAGSGVSEIERGSVILSSASWEPTRELLVSLELNDSRSRPSPRARLSVHLGTSEVGGRLVMRPEQTRDGAMRARLILDHPLIARGGDHFVIRLPSPARTIGGGIVLDPFPERRRRGTSKRISAERELDNQLVDNENRVAGLRQMVEAAGRSGVVIATIPVRTGLTPGEARSAVHEIEGVVAGPRVYTPSAVADLERSIESFVSEWMANHTLEAGVSLQTLRSSLKASSEVIDVAIGRLSERGRIDVAGSLVRPFGWIDKLGDAENALSKAILDEICAHPAEPPSVRELSERFGDKAAAVLRRLEREGALERVSDDRYYSRDAVTSMVGTMRSSLEIGRIYSPAELRGVLGVSRKYLIPFLEFCDRKGVTERREDGRAVRPMNR